MKPVLTLVLFLITGISALANTGTPVNEFNPEIKSYEQAKTHKMDNFLDSGIVVASIDFEVEIANAKSVARLYKFKNSRIKKALTFTTKRSRAKMA